MLNKQDQRIKKTWEERLCTSWDFVDLPTSLPLLNPRQEICGYLFPSIKPVRDRGGVVIEFMSNQGQAYLQNREGLNFLAQLQVAEPCKSLKKYCATSLSGPSSSWLIQGLGEKTTVVNTILSFILSSLFNIVSGPIPGREEFMTTVARGKGQDFYGAGRLICDTIVATLRQRREVSAHIQRFGELARKTRSYAPERFGEYENLLQEILPVDFLESRELSEIQRCSREMKALMLRIERAYVDPAKDALKAGQLQPHLHNLQSLRRREKDLSPECLQEMKKFQEMLAQFRISLFAPELAGGIQVSTKKLHQQWLEISKIC